MNDELEPLAYSAKQFARLCAISLPTLYKIWREGRGPKFKKLGRRRVIERGVGLAWLHEFDDADDRVRQLTNTEKLVRSRRKSASLHNAA